MITLFSLGGFPSCISHPSSNKLLCPTSSSIETFNNSTYSFLISYNYKCVLNYSNDMVTKATENSNTSAAETTFDHDGELSSRVSACKDSNQVLELIAEMTKTSSGVVSVHDCCSIISAAFDCDNADLALSVFSAMRCTFDQGSAIGDKGLSVERWKWSRPDVKTYTVLVCELAASLRVSDALRVIANVCRVGVSPSEEVPFGKIVRCPSCMIAVAVAQPQDGIQVVSCFKCRYQYELVSGDIIRIESEEISMNVPVWKRALKFLQIIKEGMPAAVHSVVVTL